MQAETAVTHVCLGCASVSHLRVADDDTAGAEELRHADHTRLALGCARHLAGITHNAVHHRVVQPGLDAEQNDAFARQQKQENESGHA